ncbi:MAG: hypothetical protein RL536_568 [Candidatus Parcubacteria bacterium]|jgi:uncharacterized membrane protein
MNEKNESLNVAPSASEVQVGTLLWLMFYLIFGFAVLCAVVAGIVWLFIKYIELMIILIGGIMLGGILIFLTVRGFYYLGEWKSKSK